MTSARLSTGSSQAIVEARRNQSPARKRRWELASALEKPRSGLSDRVLITLFFDAEGRRGRGSDPARIEDYSGSSPE
ncbi:MAG: hypothetical protein MI923_04625 [Phycisphaerales bacterium]|nr:hypothetical protein [Phycisphaerales bacterium]